MSKSSLLIIALLVAATTPGCASIGRRSSATAAAQANAMRSAAISLDPKALLRLDQIEPPVALPLSTTAPATSPVDRPPLDAIVLYAQARDDMQEGQREAAVPLLEEAVKLDPESYDLHISLARAYLGTLAWDARSLDQLRKAAELNPDHADLQTIFGRELMAKGDREEGLHHLRLALKTFDYTNDDADAAVAEWFLGNALQGEGYLTAALDLFIRLELRLGRPNFALRADPELFIIARRPEQLVARIAELHEKLGHLGEAAAVYGAIVDAHPDSIDDLRQFARALIRAGRPDEAVRVAGAQVVHTSAGHDSVTLLREVCRLAGREGEAADVLSRLHRDHPHDRPLLYALVDQLDVDDRDPDALKVMSDAEALNPGDFELFRRSISLQQQTATDPTRAARRLIAWSAANPNAIYRLDDLWTELIRPGAPGRLRLAALQQLAPDRETPDIQGWLIAKEYWVFRLARDAGRGSVARNALQRAVDGAAPFAPAYRAEVDELWQRNDLSKDELPARAEALANRADAFQNGSLASEIRGLIAFREKRYTRAVEYLTEAAKFGPHAPELDYARALAERLAGDDAKYESMLWKLVSDTPDFEQAYAALYDYVSTSRQPQKEDKVVAAWLAAEPQSIEARIHQVVITYRSGQPLIAKKLMDDLFDDKGSTDGRVLAVMQQLYSQADRADQFEKKLIDCQKSDPANLAVAARLVELFTESNRRPQASSVLAVTRGAVADDPDALYTVAHLYLRAGLTDKSEVVLRDVLRLDPVHAPAANDLGYNLADRGEDLEDAERLVRLATKAEPDNAAFLDSLGWVLYKRGKFPDAAEALGRAVKIDGEKADPVVRNHLGDALYRVGDAADAAAQWRLASERLDAMAPATLAAREDLVALRADLLQKTTRIEKKMAPTLAPAAPGAQAIGRK